MNDNGVAAYFDGHEIPPVIWYKEGASKYVISHEYFHLEEFGKIGRKPFIKGDLGSLKEWHINNILREKYVAENMYKNADSLGLSENEILHIKKYYNQIIIDAANNGVEIKPEYIIKFK
jgi:hypothetical protein